MTRTQIKCQLNVRGTFFKAIMATPEVNTRKKKIRPMTER
jgi:hypothetical protein